MSYIAMVGGEPPEEEGVDEQAQLKALICNVLEGLTEELKRVPRESLLSLLAAVEELKRECRDAQPSLLLRQRQVGERAYVLLADKILVVNELREEVMEHLRGLPRVSYFILTNLDCWELYEARGEPPRLALLARGREEVGEQLKLVLQRELQEGGLRISLTAREAVELYVRELERMVSYMQEALESALGEGSIRPLFEAFAALARRLYPHEDQEGLERLLVQHTLLHMMAVSSLAAALDRLGDPVEVASGGTLPPGLAVAVPYLNWWKVYLGKAPEAERQKIGEVVSKIAARAALVDWGEEEVFGALYESLLGPESRRRLGEYYTPAWMVDRVLAEFSLKGKVVLDPFCGSGAFLLGAFRKKVEEGESPEEALESLIGVDVNPLAVALARVALLMEYVRVTGKVPQTSPRIYHFDAIAAWLGEEAQGDHLQAGALGDYAWAGLAETRIDSLYRIASPDIIVTNPPWMRLSAVKAGYAGKLRQYVRRSLLKLGASPQKASTIANGSDISLIALALASRAAKEGVGFVMPAEQVFSSRVSVKAGLVAAYALLKDACPSCPVKLVHVKFDAFHHKIEPALVFVFKEGREGGLFEAEWREGWREKRLPQSYEEYVRPAAEWARMTREDLQAELEVAEVKVGGYIRGISGGERRGGAEPYAGLRVEEVQEEGGALRVRLTNLERSYLIPRRVMERHEVSIYELHCGALPYRAEKVKAILSRRGRKGLRGFLGEAIELLAGQISEGDKRKLLRLREEVRVQLEELAEGEPYVVYRHRRLFATYVTRGKRGEAASDIVVLVRCRSEEQAYYYAAVLHYLAFCVKRSRRSFLRTLYHKPLEAIARAGLSWKRVPEGLRRETAALSRELERRAQGLSGKRRRLLEELWRTREFQALAERLDGYVERHVGKGKLEEVLDLVSTRPRG
ncbi:MAG: N-6 DNA methylase [Acidilobaceae archaeon]|nr:N-6 DNA methylase [Acidilobaceae archaeon]